MKFIAIIACMLGFSSAEFKCSRGTNGLECFSIENVDSTVSSNETKKLPSFVCPPNVYNYLPSCLGIKNTPERNPCDATTSYGKCNNTGKPRYRCNCDSTLGK